MYNRAFAKPTAVFVVFGLFLSPAKGEDKAEQLLSV